MHSHETGHKHPHKAFFYTNGITSAVEFTAAIATGSYALLGLSIHNASDAVVHRFRDKAAHAPTAAEKRRARFMSGGILLVGAAILHQIEKYMPDGALSSTVIAMAGIDTGMNLTNTVHAVLDREHKEELGESIAHNLFDGLSSAATCAAMVISEALNQPGIGDTVIGNGHLAALAGLGAAEIIRARREFAVQMVADHFTPLPCFEDSGFFTDDVCE